MPSFYRAICALLFAGLAVPAAAQDWVPARTWVVVVGVLEWKDAASFSSFPQKNRRDAQLVAHFRERGVPADHIAYLQDRAATGAAVDRTLAEILERTRSGDTLFVYYCGHGFKDDGGDAWFATWDAGAGSTGWRVSALVDAVDRGFRGARAVLAADCCYSGALARACRGRSRGLAALASSSASELSTGNWTFTEALLDALRGAPWVDRDRNGHVDFAETAAYIADDMAFAEEQRATSATTSGFAPRTVLASVVPQSGQRLGERALVDWNRQQFKGRVIASRTSDLRIHYYGYEASDDEWVEPGRVHAAPVAKTYAVGAKVDVKWKGDWYAATVLEAKSGVHLIHYDDYDDTWDEWVSSRRIRLRK